VSVSDRPVPASPSWTIASLVKWATDDFRTRGIESARLDADLIVGHVLGLSRTEVIMHGDRPLEAKELTELRDMVKRRRAREPIAYLRGQREFYGRNFRVDKRVLIPRPETEVLVEVALRRSRVRALSMRVLDLCTGSGCVAITIARECPTATVLATDISKDALVLARENAQRLGAHRVGFVESDLARALPDASRFDLITANPPYIASGELEGLMADVRDFEPKLALDGGADGLDFYRRIAEEVPRLMADGACLVLEVGFGEADDVAKLLLDSKFRDVEVALDHAGIPRIVSARRKN
jgi:release factor glutamine methyltransferase